MKDQKWTISVTGLGYVGLPLAVCFAQKFKTIGFDQNSKRIAELRQGRDRTQEVSSSDLKNENLILTDRPEDLKTANFHIVAVPTPVDEAHIPDLRPMLGASETIGKILTRGSIVVFESTVYPGVTEDECLPILEKLSGLKSPRDFQVGYSPERINPGDSTHRFAQIRKVVSGQTNESLEAIAEVYGSVVTAGVFKAQSIKVAEAAKVIENTQRDLNIALMNELALIFHMLDIDTQAVLDAAATKWNFMPFSPGLVGGHCIGVDPYYLTHKAEKIGYHPQVILAGRRINDGMGRYVARMTIKEMIRANHNILKDGVTVLGLTFKENCPDIRNTRVIDIIQELKGFDAPVQVSDPIADPEEVHHEYGIDLVPFKKLKPAAAVIIAVAHQEYRQFKVSDLNPLFTAKSPILMDVKGIFALDKLAGAGIRHWRL